ncbi:hypothetical protein GCM10010102_45120 [Promicromonospora citrea]|uniref:Uncharacterized protein n=1 Tax=Promicromonospora citrea TaxID=43677 RepID=A0A8H9LBD8_9MICO|nr:hypothetical protein GCM10010102_45120 [Promicromonospora citrea]
MKPFSGIGTVAAIAARWISVPIMPATIGVSTTPGATALSGMPAPAHRGLVAVLRSHRHSAALLLA